MGDDQNLVTKNFQLFNLVIGELGDQKFAIAKRNGWYLFPMNEIDANKWRLKWQQIQFGCIKSGLTTLPFVRIGLSLVKWGVQFLILPTYVHS